MLNVLAKSDKPALDAAVAWIVRLLQQSERNEDDQRAQKQAVSLIYLLLGAIIGAGLATEQYVLVLLGAALALPPLLSKWARDFIADVGWLGVAGFVVGLGGWVWFIYCLGDKRFSLAALILPTVGMWGVGMFMLTRGMNRQKAKTAARQQ
ncbi:hypothetical protein FRZ61_33050 [Hypericibacter adhaerens]|uniref:Uncharacterized protein n=1 Tax=Hypericibacter adhaerens TaxID=2602016 RepID=A0A5J6N1K3_9PROT|nr:hypothetical protein FRZ61_33050 [Hypericibacter adhaerens]